MGNEFVPAPHDSVSDPERAITPVISLTGVERFFPPDVRALDGVSFTVSPGEYVALMGASGSGKTTLLNVLGLLDRPDAGRYEFEGLEVGGLSDRARTSLRSRSIGFVFQSFHLVPHLTVLENVQLGLAYAGVKGRERSERAQRALEAVDMMERARAYPRTLSGGEQQRTAIARALSRIPKLLLCDEPTGNLDSRSAENVLELLTSIRRPDRAVVVVTHNPAIAESMDRVLTVADGRIQSGEWKSKPTLGSETNA